MKNIYLTRSQNMVVDDENGPSIDCLRDIWPRIEKLYVIDEDCHVIFGGREEPNVQEFDVKAGNVIITFYSDIERTPHSVVVIDNKEFTENMIAIRGDQYKKDKQDEEYSKCENISKTKEI